MRLSAIPNLITVFRFLLVPPIVLLLLREQFGLALLLFLLAGLSDGLDGYLAKHFGWSSRLGGLMDPLADKLLLVSCYITLGGLGVIPVWLVAVVVARDLIILAGAVVYHLRIAALEAEPSVISKINTLAQILLVLVALGGKVGLVPLVWLDYLVYTVLATTLLSGADYVWTWGWRAWNSQRGTGRFP